MCALTCCQIQKASSLLCCCYNSFVVASTLFLLHFLLQRLYLRFINVNIFFLCLYLCLFLSVLRCFSLSLHLIQYMCASWVQPSLLCRSSYNVRLWQLLSCLCVLLYVPVFTWFQILRYFYDECYMAFCSSHTTVMDSFFLFVCLFCRSLTSNLPNVNLPNVNLQIPKVPNLPVPVAGLSVNLPQMPSFSTPSWMAAIYDSECVFN